MTENKFNQIWNTIGLPTINRFSEKYKDVSIKKNAKEAIFLRYEAIRESVHPQMNNPDSKIDRHKISAAFVQAVLETLPYNTPKIYGSNDDHRKYGEAYFLNEKFAFHFGISVLYSYMMDDFTSEGNQLAIDAISKGLYFPPAKHDGTYEDNVIKLLYASRMKENFDLFTMAHVFFYIENYTIVHFKSLQKGFEKISA